MQAFSFIGGEERTRTAVEGFADLCLTTRPLRRSKIVKVRKKLFFTNAYIPYLSPRGINIIISKQLCTAFSSMDANGYLLIFFEDGNNFGCGRGKYSRESIVPS
jgi:hypothetical protein